MASDTQPFAQHAKGVGHGDLDRTGLAAALNLELLPSRPGGVQLSISGMDGSVLPFTGLVPGAGGSEIAGRCVLWTRRICHNCVK